MTQTIHQETEFRASAETLYDTLLSSRSFAEFTGAPAEIDAAEGGAFTCFGGQIAGRNIELVRGKRIVQAWRVAAWDAGVFSIVRFVFKKAGSETRLILDHSSFPDSFTDDLTNGWPKMYWQPLRRYLAAAD